MSNKSIIFHIILGWLFFNYSFLSTLYAICIILYGIYSILNNHDSTRYLPIKYSAYIVGLEVLLRMNNAKLFWEFSKYSIIIFLLLGIFKTKKYTKLNILIILYFLFLLPSIIWVPSESFSAWRQYVAFNLSGPFCLLISSIYFININIKKSKLIDCISFALLPLISMSVFIVLKMPVFASYNFLPYSDPLTSGGYGPNQVSSIFGFGITILVLAMINNFTVTKIKILDKIILMSFVSLGLITFSRGGILAAIIALSIGISWKFLKIKKTYALILNSFFIVLISSFVWLTISQITGNMIAKRYGILNSIGETSILDLTGRAQIYNIDLQIFSNNIFTGVGPGMAYIEREKYGYGKKVSAHTEYSRMLAEHGLLGLLSLLCLLSASIKWLILLPDHQNKDLILVMGILALLTLFHSAMRLAMPSLAFALIFPKYEK